MLILERIPGFPCYCLGNMGTVCGRIQYLIHFCATLHRWKRCWWAYSILRRWALHQYQLLLFTFFCSTNTEPGLERVWQFEVSCLLHKEVRAAEERSSVSVWWIPDGRVAYQVDWPDAKVTERYGLVRDPRRRQRWCEPFSVQKFLRLIWEAIRFTLYDFISYFGFSGFFYLVKYF